LSSDEIEHGVAFLINPNQEGGRLCATLKVDVITSVQNRPLNAEHIESCGAEAWPMLGNGDWGQWFTGGGGDGSQQYVRKVSPIPNRLR